MPTYQLQSGITSPVSEHAVTIFSSSEAIETYTIMTEAILTFTDTGDYLVGETVTETTSGTTGRVYWKTATRLGIVDVSDLFTGGETITGSDSSEVLTPTSVSNLLNMTASTPVWTPIIDIHDLSPAGAGNETVGLDERTEWVKIWKGDVALTIYNYSTDTTLFALAAGDVLWYQVDHRISQLVLAFPSAGVCQVIETTHKLP